MQMHIIYKVPLFLNEVLPVMDDGNPIQSQKGGEGEWGYY